MSPPTSSAIKETLGVSGPPLGLAYLASVIRREGHEVRIVDSLTEGYTFDDLRRIIRGYYPDAVGITSTTSTIPDAYATAAIAKEINPEMTVIMGGPHVTFVPDLTFQECPHVDVIVRGEGEEVVRQLLPALQGERRLREVRGISYLENGVVKHNPPCPLIEELDDIPIPAYDLLPMEKYRVGGRRFGAIVTSRGCPFQCVFCSSSLLFGKRWRGHSPERVLREIKILYDDFGVREIEFLDDTFTLNRKRARDIADAIVEEGLDVSWSASSRVDTFDAELGRRMKRAGCHTVYFGIESGSQETLDMIGKGITLRQAVDAVRAAKRARLSTLGSFIIGFPHETEEDIKKTISFSKKVGVSMAQFTVATPYPGTRLWDLALKENLLLTRDWRKFTTLTVVMKSFHLTARQIQRLLRWAYISFYMRPKIILTDLIKNRGFILRRVLPAAVSYLLSSWRKWRRSARSV